jgi:hypothetical protein
MLAYSLSEHSVILSRKYVSILFSLDFPSFTDLSRDDVSLNLELRDHLNCISVVQGDGMLRQTLAVAILT